MFNAPELKDHLDNSQTIESNALVIAEWNMNDPNNFKKIGNYKRRVGVSILDTFDPNDQANAYTNGTDSDTVVAGPYDDYDEPTLFLEDNIKTKLLYSLDDCFAPNRPRSGINHLTFFKGKYIGGSKVSTQRPRYYMGSYNNQFKYWTSYRRVGGVEYGYGKASNTGDIVIEDVSPFIVYKESIATNKIVVKMQTNIGTENLGPIRTPTGFIDDPMYGNVNATTPKRWAIQALKGGLWTTIKDFQQNETRSNGDPIVPPDGYVELTYGLLIPTEYGESTRYLGTLTTATLLPEAAFEGDFYYIISNEDAVGVVYIWHNGTWEVFFPTYGWKLKENYDAILENLVTDLTNPVSYLEGGQTKYREFEYIDGLRLVVYTMNKLDATFDLIELSPRLQVDMTDKTIDYKLTKPAGAIDQTALPMGGLQAGGSSINIFDCDYALSETNTQSIVHKRLQENISFSFYDVIKNVNGADYIIPLKKLHTEGKYPGYSDTATVSFELRDSYFLFENAPAPALMLTDVSLSYAISVLLDFIGFSNYVFRRAPGVPEPIIPFFYVAPDQNVAETLQKLAIATQSSMFFDEYNNFVVMYKEYLMPTANNRPVDIVFDGDSDTPNIINIASKEKKVYNSGTINYTERYIQRSIGSLTQASFVNEDQTYIYLPALLWEVSGTEATRTINDKVATQSNYSLGAMPLNANLAAVPPSVTSRKLINHTIDVGESVYWLPRYQGYLYANGEIIRFDAVQYAIQGHGVEWISSNDEYQKYFADLTFNGKMFPTGIVRIFAEPYYETINGVEYMKNGQVARHGRAQFGTTITTHNAGISSEWTSNNSVAGCKMESKHLFDNVTPPATRLGNAGLTNKALLSSRNGVIKNFFRNVNYTESQLRTMTTARAGTIQSSALVFSGPPMGADAGPRDYISYVHKSFGAQPFRHFGTRMRIIGKVEAAADIDQSPVGSMSFYSTELNGESLLLNGGSGGVGVGVNKTTNNGYFFEIIALTNTNLNDISSSDDGTGAHNVIFYKVAADSSGNAIPIKLWGGLTDILVDSGIFAGQVRADNEENTTVYDLSVEYVNIGSTRRFYLYINNQQVATVDDSVPLPEYNSMCLFVRGTSKVMFENIFAIRQNLSISTSNKVVSDGLVSEAFGRDIVDARAFRRFGISGIVQKTFLSGISSVSSPQYNMFFDEFGTILRECAYFDIKYDKAYPALYAQISPTFNDSPGYTISGLKAGSYGAKFLVFNVTDKALNLDETSGNYLRMQGVVFTQDTTHEYTIDNYYGEVGNLSDPDITPADTILRPPRTEKEKFRNVKISRMKYGKSDWSLQSDYIQSQSSAMNLMEWLINKTTRARLLVGVEIMNNPMIQLGDIGTIQYSSGGVDKVAKPSKKFVIYNIEQSRDFNGPKTTVYMSEV